jgi:pimeloyl-ACP methyl ester carboxylesterase
MDLWRGLAMKVFWRTAGLVLLLLLAAGAVFYRYPLWVLDQQSHFILWRSGVKHRFVQASGHRLHFYEANATDGSAGTPLVLVHGLGSRGEDWAKLIPGFAAAGFHVYAPDLLGYGRSDRPDVSYTIALEEQTVVEFMQAMHVERADVIGWSMGGWIAMSLALDHPAMVTRLVIYDSAGTYFPAVLPPGLFTPTDVAGVQRLYDVLEPESHPLPAFVARDTLQKSAENGWIIDRSLASMVSGRYLLDFRLGALKMPMLIVWGGSDRLIPPAVGESIHRAIPQSVYEVVEGCGHLGPGECPKPYVEGTVEFLKANPPMRRGEKTFPKPQ